MAKPTPSSVPSFVHLASMSLKSQPNIECLDAPEQQRTVALSHLDSRPPKGNGSKNRPAERLLFGVKYKILLVQVT